MDTTLLNRVDKKNNFAEKKVFKFNGSMVEACVLNLAYRPISNVICISSQIGCPYSCKICANGKIPFVRNLSAEEMVNQVDYFLERKNFFIRDKFDITLMGVGEPLENFENVIQFINFSFLKWEKLNKVNISTIGLIDKINQLAFHNFKNKVHLQISLHASTDKTRKAILDWKLDSIEGLIGSAEAFSKKMDDRICYNYVMIKEMNDSLDDIEILAHLLKDKKAYVKLSELNPVENGIYEASQEDRIKQAKMLLEKYGIETHLFKSVGSERHIGCGQLSANIMQYSSGKLVYV